MSSEIDENQEDTLQVEAAVPKETLDAPKLAPVDSIVDDLVGKMSPPSENAIAAHNQEQERNNVVLGAEHKGKLDMHGTAFDPAVHKVNQKTGLPVKSKTGKWFVKNNVTAPQSKAPRKSMLGTAVIAQEENDIKAQEEVRATGKVAAQILFTLGRTIGGDDFIPRPEEDAMISDAFAVYMQSKNMKDLPPGVALCVAIMAYVLPRFAQPAVAKKLDKAKAGFWVWMQGFKRKGSSLRQEDSKGEIIDNNKPKDVQ